MDCEREEMRMKCTAPVVLVCGIWLSACSTQTSTSPYRPANSSAQWLIDGEISPTYEASFFINGELAAKGQLSGGSGGIVRGEYRGLSVSVTCKHTTKVWSTEDECDVFIDREFATRLRFSKDY